ncbi:MAG: Stp1/IreP family PP2C-type Ser/Thr phosphatase [Actinobacteria bacterium]|nr:Stp1/IreP family PP2C-type Ser/Thr phosphatase [Actinomycetota bacterium]
MALRIEDSAVRTDTGRQRNANEDSVFTRAELFVVADGMGGAQAGEVASRTAVSAFEGELRPGPPERVLEQTIKAANRAIHQQAQGDPNLAGMGTTTTAAIVDPAAEEVAIGHVGDSRAYRYRRGKLERLTRDHSLVEEMRRKGQLTDAQAEDHPQRSIITRALGPEPEVEVDLQTVPAQAGDVFLICSDGLTTMLDDEHIARLLSRASSMESAVRALVDEANRAGGRDNITVIAFRLGDPDRAPAGEEGATLIGPSAAEAGLSATEVKKRAAAEAARQRREELEARPRHRRLRTAAKVLVPLLIIAALLFGAWYGNRQVWFLGTDSGGRVALYRGVPYELPLGIKLYSERYSIPVQTTALSGRRLDAVTGHSLRSRSDAVQLLEEIEREQRNAARAAVEKEAAEREAKAKQEEAATREAGEEAAKEPTPPQKKQGGK